jgi:hypothetical protein
MFVQIIEGRTSDVDGMRRQNDRWMSELRPGADGFLGATMGAADDGRFFAAVRFASAEQARANSERPEQGQWWAETEKYFDGPVSFVDSTDVTEWHGGGSDDAGFVQVMRMQGVDRGRVEAFDDRIEPFAHLRPDLLGGIRVWTGPDSTVEVVYFTSEADARAGEGKQMPPEMAEVMEEFSDVMAGAEYLDLREPWLFSA